MMDFINIVKEHWKFLLKMYVKGSLYAIAVYACMALGISCIMLGGLAIIAGIIGIICGIISGISYGYMLYHDTVEYFEL